MRTAVNSVLGLFFKLRLGSVLVMDLVVWLYRSLQIWWWTALLMIWIVGVGLINQPTPPFTPSPITRLTFEKQISQSGQPQAFWQGSPAALNKETQRWFDLYQLQPTHRDVLINLAVLLEAQQENLAEYFWLEARQQDPNNSFFALPN